MVPFTLFNIGMNLVLLDNQIYFATGKSYFRIYNDIFIILFLAIIWAGLNLVGIKSSVFSALYSLVIAIFMVNIINAVRRNIRVNSGM